MRVEGSRVPDLAHAIEMQVAGGRSTSFARSRERLSANRRQNHGLGDWRGRMLSHVRALIRQAIPPGADAPIRTD
ncbi:hypothetical protein GCM10008179_27500 [Hansschlegelia plantiphila]|uniref:Uncharacterized protein n=1 Tax=Hansschlegelia plantiphila TaxID=374655 RepID=A0A9W6J2H1_9HYPH|nr:hypothetical protein GCM10008179_27500 [Hansschlegelia plantiphila]